MAKNKHLTRKRLLEVLSGSTWSSDALDSKRALYDKYSARLRCVLAYCPNNISFEGVEALEIFRSESALEDFIYTTDESGIEKHFEAVFAAIEARGEIFVGHSAVLAKQQEKHRTGFRVLGGVFVAVALLIMGLGIVGAFCDFPEWLVRLANVAGPLDGLAGLVFFIYEFFEDRKEQAMQNEMGYITAQEDDGPSQSFQGKSIKVKGNGQVGNFYNGQGPND